MVKSPEHEVIPGPPTTIRILSREAQLPLSWVKQPCGGVLQRTTMEPKQSGWGHPTSPRITSKHPQLPPRSTSKRIGWAIPLPACSAEQGTLVTQPARHPTAQTLSPIFQVASITLEATHSPNCPNTVRVQHHRSQQIIGAHSRSPAHAAHRTPRCQASPHPENGTRCPPSATHRGGTRPQQCDIASPQLRSAQRKNTAANTCAPIPPH